MVDFVAASMAAVVVDEEAFAEGEAIAADGAGCSLSTFADLKIRFPAAGIVLQSWLSNSKQFVCGALCTRVLIRRIHLPARRSFSYTQNLHFRENR